MNEPRWLTIARSYEGVSEIPGPRSSPVIMTWAHRLRSWYNDDDVPWCGLFMAAVMDEAGLGYPREYLRARAWLEFGFATPLPLVGSVVVFERGPTMGHVAIVAGVDAQGRLLCLGGNQGNAVNVSAFPRARALSYRWPHEEPMPAWNASLPTGAAAASTGEA